LEAKIKRLNAKHKDIEEQIREGEEETERLNNEQYVYSFNNTSPHFSNN